MKLKREISERKELNRQLRCKAYKEYLCEGCGYFLGKKNIELMMREADSISAHFCGFCGYTHWSSLEAYLEEGSHLEMTRRLWIFKRFNIDKKAFFIFCVKFKVGNPEQFKQRLRERWKL